MRTMRDIPEQNSAYYTLAGNAEALLRHVLKALGWSEEVISRDSFDNAPDGTRLPAIVVSDLSLAWVTSDADDQTVLLCLYGTVHHKGSFYEPPSYEDVEIAAFPAWDTFPAVRRLLEVAFNQRFETAAEMHALEELGRE